MLLNHRIKVKEDGTVGDGSIIKRFDKTSEPVSPNDVVCPHFLELKWATGCPFNCAWCYLHGTLRFQPQKKAPRVKEYGRIEAHVRSFLEQVDWGGELLNTGELADSLMHDNNGNPFSKFIIRLFKAQSRHKVLFLSKSTYIKNLLEIDGQSHAVVSFSLNAEPVAKRWENGAPNVLARIEAAGQVNRAGYEVRIRIDPMVPVLEWEKSYFELIDRIFEKLTPSRITLGSLRGLQTTIRNSPDKSWTEFLSDKSNWGRRVDSNTRFWTYLKILNYLKAQYGYRNIALCKETKAMWQKLNLDYRNISCNCIL